MKEATRPLATGDMHIGSLELERSETFTVLDMVCDRERREKSENPQHLAGGDSRCVPVSAFIGPLTTERPEVVTILNMIRA
jgi:hypothetical protein